VVIYQFKSDCVELSKVERPTMQMHGAEQ